MTAIASGAGSAAPINEKQWFGNLEQTVTHRLRLRILQGQKRSPVHCPRCSDIGPCDRELKLQVEHWDKRPLPDEDLLLRFEIGSERHATTPLKIQTALEGSGAEIYPDETAFKITDKSGKTLATGHRDGRLVLGGTEAPFELKTLQSFVYDRIDSVDDFYRMGGFWEKYPRQLMLYCWQFNSPVGVWILEALDGRRKLIPFYLYEHLDELEALLQRLQRVADAETADDLGFHDDPGVCAKCWARTVGVCFPPSLKMGDGIKAIDSEEMAEDLAIREKTAAARSEYESADRRVKERIKAMGEGKFIAGDFLISAKESTVRIKARAVSEQKRMNIDIEKIEQARSVTE